MIFRLFNQAPLGQAVGPRRLSIAGSGTVRYFDVLVFMNAFILPALCAVADMKNLKGFAV
jgi:hypothetical protein